MFTVYVQYKKMLQYSTTTVKYSTVQLSAHTGISDSLSYFHYFLPCLDLRKLKHRTLSYPTKTVRHFQNHELHRKMPQPRFPRSIFRKFSSLNCHFRTENIHALNAVLVLFLDSFVWHRTEIINIQINI